MRIRRGSLLAVVLTSAMALVVSASPTVAGPGKPGAPAVPDAPLPLGAPGLTEQRSSEVLQPGVTLTTIVRGALDGTEKWTVEMIIPGGETDPDPDAPLSALRDEDSAKELAEELTDDGFDARAEPVDTPPTVDYVGGLLGWRVRVGAFADKAGADAEASLLTAAGYSSSVFFTGWDGDDADDAGPWVVQAITIEPRQFRGQLDASFGPDLENKETTSDLAAVAGAKAGVNAGFFVFSTDHGAPGDPAGMSVYNGDVLSEDIGGRPSLMFREDARHTAVERHTWKGWVVSKKNHRLRLDGINRVPGKIRNCGGIGDTPTDLPLHDVTCTDDDELVVFTPEFADSTPTGDGVEVVLNSKDRVVEVRNDRGVELPAGGRSVQATGDQVDGLLAVATIGARLRIDAQVKRGSGAPDNFSPRESVVNGGPELVRDGDLYATVSTDGFVHPDNPSFYYGWAHKRNPRTFGGVDSYGRTVLITSDGRSTDAFGLSIPETAAVAQGLGLEDAVNLDGGGSTTMVIDDEVVNSPSGAERTVGDALLILPDRRTGKP